MPVDPFGRKTLSRAAQRLGGKRKTAPKMAGRGAMAGLKAAAEKASGRHKITVAGVSGPKVKGLGQARLGKSRTFTVKRGSSGYK